MLKIGGPIAKVILEDGRVFRVGPVRPIRKGEKYLHFRFIGSRYDDVVFGVDTWRSEDETFLPGLLMIEEKSC